jgi:lysophospholipase L1-like esterase
VTAVPGGSADLVDAPRCRGDRGYVTDVRMPAVLAIGVLIVVVTVLAIRVAYGSSSDDSKPRALILGDSITDHGQRALNDSLGPLYALSIDGQDNFRIDDQLPAAERWATRPFRQVVINLGTNDAVQGWPTDQSTANLTKLVSMFPDAECIHLTTVNEHLTARSADVETLATQINDRIHGLAAADPRIHVVDWNAIVEANLAQGVDLTSDGVHPTAEGNQLLIDAYETSMASCYRP